MAPANKPKFSENEKVLCYHGPLLYEAKCVKVKRETGKGGSGTSSGSGATGTGSEKSDFLYRVHYQGWNKNWDEWVPEQRILKMNAEGLEKKDRLLQDHLASTKEKKKSSKGSKTPTTSGSSNVGMPGPGGASSESGGRKSDSANTSRASTPVSERSLKGNKRLMQDDEQSTSSREEETLAGPSLASNSLTTTTTSSSRRKRNRTDEDDSEENCKFKVALPEELKYVLVSDWDLVVQKKRLFILPAKTPASSILTEFNTTILQISTSEQRR